MYKSIIKYSIIASIIFIIGIVGYKWHQDNKECSIREAVAQKEGENIQLKKQDSINKILLKSQQIAIDNSKTSSAKSIHDTIYIYKNYEKAYNIVKHLDTTAIVSYLQNRLTQDNNNR